MQWSETTDFSVPGQPDMLPEVEVLRPAHSFFDAVTIKALQASLQSFSGFQPQGRVTFTPQGWARFFDSSLPRKPSVLIDGYALRQPLFMPYWSSFFDQALNRARAQFGEAKYSALSSSGNDIFTKVLLHFNGADASTTFTDSNIGGTTKTFTANGNAQIDTAQSKFGGASGLFDGTGDYLTSTDHADFEVSGNYTIDFWIRPNVLAGADRCVVSKSDSVGVGKYFGPYVIRYETASGNLVFYSSSDGTTWNIANAQSFGTISTGIWYHIAVVRSGNDYFLFKDGTQITTFSSSLTPINNTENFMLGRFVDTNDWNGWIEEFRLSTAARWTSGFTPPTAEYY